MNGLELVAKDKANGFVPTYGHSEPDVGHTNGKSEAVKKTTVLVR